MRTTCSSPSKYLPEVISTERVVELLFELHRHLFKRRPHHFENVGHFLGGVDFEDLGTLEHQPRLDHPVQAEHEPVVRYHEVVVGFLVGRLQHEPQVRENVSLLRVGESELDPLECVVKEVLHLEAPAEHVLPQPTLQVQLVRLRFGSDLVRLLQILKLAPLYDELFPEEAFSPEPRLEARDSVRL